MARKVWLVAAYSLDIEGPRRLREALDEIGERLGGWEGRKIGLQTSKEIPPEEIIENTLQVREILGEAMDASPSDNETELGKDVYRALGYRASVAAEYALKGAKLEVVDHPAAEVLKRARLPKTEEQIWNLFVNELLEFESAMDELGEFDPETFSTGLPYEELKERYVDFHDLKYQFGTKIGKESLGRVRDTFEAAGIGLKEFLEEREEYIADQITSKGVDVFIGGIEHVYGVGDLAPESCLYDRLKERGLRVHRVRLDFY